MSEQSEDADEVDVVVAQREHGVGVMLLIRGSRAPVSLERAVARRLPSLTARVDISRTLATRASPDEIAAAIEREVAATSFEHHEWPTESEAPSRWARAWNIFWVVVGWIVLLAVIVFVGLVIFLPDTTDEDIERHDRLLQTGEAVTQIPPKPARGRSRLI